MTCGPRPCPRDVELAGHPVQEAAGHRRGAAARDHLAQAGASSPVRRPVCPWRAERLWPQFSIAYPENLTGEAAAMVAEQVRDDVCDLVGCTWPVDFERHSVDGDVALTQL